jgi:hypothetical protein
MTMKYWIAYLLNNDTVAYGLGDVGTGGTKEQAIANLRSMWEHDEGTEDLPWDESVEDGEAIRGWGTDKMRLFAQKITI